VATSLRIQHLLLDLGEVSAETKMTRRFIRSKMGSMITNKVSVVFIILTLISSIAVLLNCHILILSHYLNQLKRLF
jgi:hypothetical protein